MSKYALLFIQGEKLGFIQGKNWVKLGKIG
jgi:hypothetical protein